MPPPRPSSTSTPSPPTSARAPAASAAVDDPTVITVKHWSRLFDGDLYASSSRLDWAVLLRRTHGGGGRVDDALACPSCEGRLRPIATITDPAVAKKILVHLGRRAEPLPRARARDPTGQESFDFHAA